MIKIKKLKKINELFTFDGQNIFPYKEDGGFVYFTDEIGTQYKVLLLTNKLNGKLKTLEIEYGIHSKEKMIIEPIKGKLDNNKLKVFNTVLNIIKEKIDNFNPDVITFSGNNSNGLSDFYSMLIKSLRLKEYKVYTNFGGKYKNFTLIKDFEFIDCVNVIYYQQEGNIFRIEYVYDGLDIRNTDYQNNENIDFDLEKVIKFCVPDRETIDSSWVEDGDGWVKIFLYFDVIYKVNISQTEIQNTINYLENLGLKFHRSEKDEIVFYDPAKVK